MSTQVFLKQYIDISNKIERIQSTIKLRKERRTQQLMN